jgi:hypothetical protein
MKRSRLLLALAFAVAGCGAPEAPREGAQAVVGGVDSTHARDAVIQVGSPAGLCSGALVAPNLVLTALHCVAEPAGTNAQCDTSGDPIAPDGTPWPDGDKFGADRDPASLTVLSGGQGPTPPVSVTSPDASFAHGKQIFHVPDARQCKTDTALVLLDRDVDDPVLAPLRLDTGVEAGEALLVVGWGLFPGKSFAATRQEREVSVIHVGPAAPDFQGDVAVPPGFFSVGESACSGDSGSPALAGSGAIVGVASTLEKPNLFTISSADDCKGDQVRVHYQAAVAEKDVILAAFAAAGHEPWLEGTPDPRAGLAGFEAPCATDADCQSNACVPDRSGVARCTVGCLGEVCPAGATCPPSTCPAGYRCALIGQHDRCAQAPDEGGTGGGGGAEPQPSDPPSGGCATSPGTPHAPVVAALAAIAALGRSARSRSRRRRARPLSA